jgi:hypothetical protein
MLLLSVIVLLVAAYVIKQLTSYYPIEGKLPELNPGGILHYLWYAGAVLTLVLSNT